MSFLRRAKKLSSFQARKLMNERGHLTLESLSKDIGEIEIDDSQHGGETQEKALRRLHSKPSWWQGAWS